MNNSEQKAEGTTQSQHGGNAVLPARCRSCRWWRDKAWDGDEGIGICDNPTTIEQVTLMSEALLGRFVAEPPAARMIAQSLRFSSEFGCIHWAGNGC